MSSGTMNWEITSLVSNLSAVIAKRIGFFLALALAFTSRDVLAAYSQAEMAEVRTEDENKLKELRRQEVEQLRVAIGRRLAPNRLADLYVRLAESYLESYRAEFINEGKVHEKRLAEGRADKYIDRAHSKPYIRLGIKACEEVIRLKINHPKLDEIYYFLGVYYDELEDEKNSLKYFEQLTKLFSDSPYIGEAYRALAEGEYEKSNFRKALSLYEAARRNYKGAAYPRLLQKMAWTHYRLKQFDKAISTMKEAITVSSKDEKFLNLKDEALRDMAIFMTEGGRVNEAIAYFKSVGGDKDFYPKTLAQLGAQYERNAEPAKAILVYESLLKTNPDIKDSFPIRVKLFEVDVKRGRYADAIKRVLGIELPDPGDDDENEIASQNLKSMMRKQATEHHDRFRRTQDKGSLAVAENFYTFYLNQYLTKSDPKKEIPEIQMYLAEVKRDLGKSVDAANLYKQVIRSQDERYAKQAAGFWMSSLYETIKKAKASGKTPNDLAQIEKDYVEASDYVSENLKNKPEGLEARLNVAQVLAGNPDKQKEAITRLEGIIEAAPSSKQAVTAAKLLFQLHADRLPKSREAISESNEGKELMELVSQFKSNTKLMSADAANKGELKSLIEGLDVRMKIGQIASQEKAKDFGAAARGYEDFARKEKNRETAEKAYVNAASSYLKAFDYENSVRLIGQWLGRYPDSKPALVELRNTATNAIITGNFERAALLFRLLGRKSDPNALEAAGRLFEGTGNLTEAAADFRYYSDHYKTSGDRGPILLSLAQWYEFSKNDPKAIVYYKRCFDEDSATSSECGARLADLYSKLENPARANFMHKAVSNRGSGKKSDTSPWVGYSRYRLAELTERDQAFSRLSLPDDKLKRGLEQRLKFLEKLNQSYQTVVEVAGPWAIAALDRLATWVHQFAQDVDQIDPPKGATPEQIAGFRKSLKSVSDPLRQKAADTWKTAYQKANDKELLSPVLSDIGDQLADFGVPGITRAQGFRDKFRLSGQPADGGKDGRATAFERVRKTLLDNANNVQAWIDYGNLLWGEGKPLLAKIAYERALLLDPKAAAALNNRGVLIVSGIGQEDWIRVDEANQFFKSALKKDELFLAAKFNRGAILNYYRIFPKAKAYWLQVSAVAPQADVLDGLAITETGLGNVDGGAKIFEKAEGAGADSSRPSRRYHQAAAYGRKDASKCLSEVSKIDTDAVWGFEKQAIIHLRTMCQQWKDQKSL